jgi:hypothetical protein
MEQAVKQGGHGGGIPEQFPPVVDRPVRSQQGGGPLVAAHDQFEEIFGGGMRQPPHAEVINDQQRDGRELRQVRLARAIEGGVGDLLDEGVRLTVHDTVALLDGGVADGLREMALTSTGRAEKKRIFPLLDEARGGEFVDQRAVHLLVEIEIEAVKRAVGITEACLFVPPLEEPILSAHEFVGDEHGDEVRASVKAKFDDTGRDMKRDGGLGLLLGSDREAAVNLLKRLAEYGLFVVPIGEVESWLQHLAVAGHGPAWLMQMFERMGENPSSPDYVRPGTDDVWTFLESVKAWLTDSVRRGMPS